MAVERELKHRLSDPSKLRAILQELGATPTHRESFEDNRVFDRESELVAGDRLLRLRTDGEGARLTYKGPASFDAAVKERIEFETRVADSQAMTSILTSLGYREVRRYQKYREEWSLDDVVIALDRTPIGDFVEFEGEAALAVSRRCGFEPDAALADNYLGLYDAYRRRHPEAPRQMVFGAAESRQRG